MARRGAGQGGSADMSGTINIPDHLRDAGHAEAIALFHEIIGVCDGHDTAAVLAALTTVCAFSLDDIGVDVDTFVHRLRVDAAKIKRAKRAAPPSTGTSP